MNIITIKIAIIISTEMEITTLIKQIIVQIMELSINLHVITLQIIEGTIVIQLFHNNYY